MIIDRMGKNKKRHNWKARTNTDTKIDRTEQQKIKLEIEESADKGYDDCNALVLPSTKRKTKSKTNEVQVVKQLSKKKRKYLEKIIEKKEKKLKRAEIMDSLQKLVPSSQEMSMLSSISEVHSGKYKRQLEIQRTPEGEIKVNAISGSNKKRKIETQTTQTLPSSSSSSSESSSDEENDEETEETQQEDEDDTKVEETVSRADNEEAKSQSVPHNELVKEKCKTAPDESKDRKPVVHVPLNRSDDIQAARLRLPILGEEQIIMEAINENPIVILCGETGSGKTTQVPQFLYEAGYASGGAMIAVTEPRRVAAISMSSRVAMEMALTAREVSYQIRYEGNVTEDTKIKFMTDGVLLKEVQKDFLLSKYSVVIVDEAHERSVYTDILLGLLSRIVPLRAKKGKPLKLVIMSATLRVEDFTENKRLFKITPPVIKVDARQFPVSIHFNKRTPFQDYLGEAYKKVCKIHKMLPEGGILVFVTGQQEVHTLCKKLRTTFPAIGKGQAAEKMEQDSTKPALPKLNLDDYSVMPLDEEADQDMNNDDALSDDSMLGSDEELEETESGRKVTECLQPLYVLPLYSLLSTDKQKKVFGPVPEGSRLCVVSTNVAETSLTIPGIKYVVDTGKAKTKLYDKVTGVSTFKVTWTSQASANQRAGRAGRVGPGHCYRLYSSAVFNDEFQKFSPPEISRRPVDDLVLQMKDMNIDKVVNFPFPTPPDHQALMTAEKLLLSLGALELSEPVKPKNVSQQKENTNNRITGLGRAMASFPVAPRYAKMLSLGHQHNLLPYVVAIVSALSVQELFAESDFEKKEETTQKQQKFSQIRKTWAGLGNSLLLGDLMVLLKAVGACEFAGYSVQFCEQYGIRYKAMGEIRKLRKQLTNTVNAVIKDVDLVIDPKMQPPSDLQAKLLRQIVLSGLADHVARKLPDPLPGAENAKELKHAYQCTALDDPVFIHPASALYKQNAQYVVYQDIAETSKLYMRGVCAVEDEWFPQLLPYHCHFSKPLDEPVPCYESSTGNVLCHVTSTFGRLSWPVSAVEVQYPEGLERYKWFSRFLLEGKVLPKLEKFVPILLSAPVTMIKTWAKLQPRTETLLKSLIAENVDSRESLIKIFTSNKEYLLRTYLEWIPKAKHKEVEEMWPPI